jgi:3-phenylpropionate/trans-cinnamate dioxygenase ferredoxin subunit
MATVRVKTLKDGPYEVKGTIQLVDAKTGPFTVKDETVYLCRCGQSAKKPFCDGTHAKVGFTADEPAR